MSLSSPTQNTGRENKRDRYKETECAKGKSLFQGQYVMYSDQQEKVYALVP